MQTFPRELNKLDMKHKSGIADQNMSIEAYEFEKISRYITVLLHKRMHIVKQYIINCFIQTITLNVINIQIHTKQITIVRKQEVVHCCSWG